MASETTAATPGEARRDGNHSLGHRAARLLLRCLGQSRLDDPLTELLRIVRFALVGVAATITHLGTTVLLIEGLALNPVAASTLGVCVSFWISYYGHQTFSFAVERDHRGYLIRFLVSSVLAFALNLSIVGANTYLLHFPYPLALAVLAVVIPGTSYLLNRFWVFSGGLDKARSNSFPVTTPEATP